MAEANTYRSILSINGTQTECGGGFATKAEALAWSYGRTGTYDVRIDWIDADGNPSLTRSACFQTNVGRDNQSLCYWGGHSYEELWADAGVDAWVELVLENYDDLPCS